MKSLTIKTALSLSLALSLSCSQAEFTSINHGSRPKKDEPTDPSQDIQVDPEAVKPEDKTPPSTPDEAIDAGRDDNDEASFGGGKILDDTDGFDDGFVPEASMDEVEVPRFGMLINNLECASCHLTVNGNVASTSPVNNWSTGHAVLANEIYNGYWFAASTWTNVTLYDPNVKYPINIAGTDRVKQNYKGRELPADLDKNGQPDFPKFDSEAIASKAKGLMSGKNQAGKAVSVKKVHNGPLVIMGTEKDPIRIAGEIVIKGDLVIKGYYTGVGTIYVSGNIYIPSDLHAVDSPFPFSESAKDALARAKELVLQKKGDALGLATPGSILLGDLKTSLYGVDNYDAFAAAIDADPNRTPEQKAAEKQGQLDMLNRYRRPLKIDNVYSWYPGSRDGYEALYATVANCLTGEPVLAGTQIPNKGSINLVEAYLYAAKMVGGISRQSSWAINGGVIADEMHIIGRAGTYRDPDIMPCGAQPNPVNGLPQDRNYINYDFRMEAGLQILRAIAPYFRTEATK